MKYKLVKVEWDDAYGTDLWKTHDDLVEEFLNGSQFQCINVGWLIEKNSQCIVLASRIAPNEEQFGLIQTLPKKMIKKITYL